MFHFSSTSKFAPSYDKILLKYVEICCNWKISRNFSSAPVTESNDGTMTRSWNKDAEFLPAQENK